MADNTENLTPMQKLHYQMLRKHYNGTLDDAINALKSKIAAEDRKDGEPMVIYYKDEDGQEVGAIFAVPSSGGTGEGYMFYNADQIDKRFEEDELVTAEALLDLDERISGITSQLTAFTENASDKIVITKDIKALGVSAGAIAKGDVVTSGTTLTEFVEQLLTMEKQPTTKAPTLTWKTESLQSLPTNNETYEVGTTFSGMTFDTQTTDGKYVGGSVDGFDYQEKDAGVTFGTVAYKINNAEATSTYNANTIGTVKITASVSYTGSTAADANATTNKQHTATTTLSDGSLTATGVTFNVRSYAYWGATSALTAADFETDWASNRALMGVHSDTLPTDTSVKTMESGAKFSNQYGATGNKSSQNLFILTDGVIDYVENSSISGTDQKTHFTGPNDDYAMVKGENVTITTPNGVSRTLKLYIYKCNTGLMELKNLKIKKG